MFSGDGAPIARRRASEPRTSKNLRYVIVEVWRKLFHFRHADLIQWDAFRYGVHEVLSQIGRQKTWVDRCFLHAVAVDCQVGQHDGKHPQRALNCIDRIEQRSLVFLDIAIVRGRRRFHRRQHRHEIPIKPASLAACQFSHVRVFLLRHQAGVRGKRIAKFQKTEFDRAPDDHLQFRFRFAAAHLRL
jgi:hypothetical protein